MSLSICVFCLFQCCVCASERERARDVGELYDLSLIMQVFTALIFLLCVSVNVYFSLIKTSHHVSSYRGSSQHAFPNSKRGQSIHYVYENVILDNLAYRL